MNSPPAYSAERAANVVLGLSVVAALVSVGAGILRLREGDGLGWLLLAVGLLPLAAAILIRASIRRSGK